MAPTTNYGSCLCGGVEYSVEGALRPVIYCHCKQCQRTSGHFVAATACALSNLNLISEETLRWYDSSSKAQRGFCKACGSNLFWRPIDGEQISIMAGTLDQPTGITAKEHIFVNAKGDYFEIRDGLPQHNDYGASVLDDFD